MDLTYFGQLFVRFISVQISIIFQYFLGMFEFETFCTSSISICILYLVLILFQENESDRYKPRTGSSSDLASYQDVQSARLMAEVEYNERLTQQQVRYININIDHSQVDIIIRKMLCFIIKYKNKSIGGAQLYFIIL